MHKILVFDLDGTLAEVGKGILQENIEKLRILEKMGYKIAVCSGKPTYYLCGMFRQVDIDSPIFIGENGGVIQYGIDLPPKRFIVQYHSEKAKEQLFNIKRRIAEECKGIWFQPNEIGVTPFCRDERDFEIINRIIREEIDNLSELDIYPQKECFDFVPKNISKAEGLRLLAKKEAFEQTDFVALGDGINDISMFEFADVSVIIGNSLDYQGDYRFEDIGKALDFLIEARI